MPAIRRILVAIKDPESRSLPAIPKALRLARAFDAELILFHAITTVVPADAYLYTPLDVKAVHRNLLAKYQRRLEAIAERVREQGVRARVCAAWDFPTHEAIVRHARKHKADLIVADCHTGRRFAPWLIHLTDWELLRTSPVPVLLVKSNASWDDVNVLAAIDPSHRFAKPAKLDARILAAATEFTSALRGTLHVVHSYVPVPAGAVPMGGASALLVKEISEASEARAKKNLWTALTRLRLPRERRHLVQGSPIDTIPSLAQELHAGLVVMGAVSRSGLKRVLIGNTAERVLGSLQSDVLVVKPAEFHSRVSRQGRGIHFVGLPTMGMEA